jgi:hypothetical protein
VAARREIGSPGTTRPADAPAAKEVVQRVRRSNPRLGAEMQYALGYEAAVVELLMRIVDRRGDRFVPPLDLFLSADTSATPTYQPTYFDGW